MRYLLLILILITIAVSSQAQNLHQITGRDTQFHLFKLYKAQLQFIKKEGAIKDTSYLQTNFYKSIATPFTSTADSLLPYGTYCQATIAQNKITYSLCSKLPFTISVKKINEDVIIYLKDVVNKNELISDAEIFYHNNIATYDSGYGGYVIPKLKLKKKEKLTYLTINYKGNDYFYDIIKSKEPKANLQSTFKGNHLYGYVLTDKPKYKPLDTLKVKAYLLNTDGIPLKEQITCTIKDLNTYKEVYSKKINQTTPGAYLLQLKLSDTLKLDRDYQITFTQQNNQSKSANFRLEEYKLNNSVLSCAISNNILYAGDSVVLNIKTSDANGFGLNIVKLKYTVSINNITNIQTDSFRLTNDELAKFIQVDTILSYNTNHQIIIKPNQLPKISASYNIALSLEDEQNELKNFNFNFNVNNIAERYYLIQQEDSLFANYTYKGSIAKGDFILKYYDGNYKIADSIKITTPFATKINPTYRQASLYKGNEFVANVLLNYNALELMHVQGARNPREVKIAFKYPFKELVHYKIYKGAEVIKSAQGYQLDFTTTDSSLSIYKILVSTNFNNAIENNCQWYYFYPLSKKLNITTTLPDQAFPGQTLNVDFEVTDFYGKPIRNINMASYAINTMFEDSEPYLDVPANLKMASKTIAENGTYGYLSFQQLVAGNSYYLKSKHVSQYNLFKNDYYKLLFASGGVSNVKKSKQQKTPEVVIGIVRNGLMYAPKSASVNGNLLYVNNISNPHQYSFLLPANTYTFQVRAFDKLLQTTAVITEYNKHYIFINLDSVEANNANKVTVLKAKMDLILPDSNEIKAIENACVLFANLNIDSNLSVTNTEISNKQYNFRYNTLPSLRVENDNYNVLLPFNIPMANIMLDKKDHYLSTGKKFHYYDLTRKEFIEKTIPKTAPYFFTYSESGMTANDLLFQVEPDTIKQTPQIKEQSVALVQYNNVIAQPWTYYYHNQDNYKNSWGLKIFEHKRKLKGVWVIDKLNNKKSIFYSGVAGSHFYSSSVNTPLDIYIFYADSTFTKLSDIQFLHQDNFYIHSDSLVSKPYTEKDLIAPLNIYESVTRIPYVNFYNAPQEQYGLTTESTGIGNNLGKAYLRGYVNNNLQPISSAEIIVEQNGKFISGATANAKGSFELLNLNEGIYDIKVFHPNYQSQYFYEVKLGGKFAQITTIKMTELIDVVPKFEAINNSFRYACLKSKSKGLDINAYNELTRKQLLISNVTVIYNNGIAKNYIVNNNTFNLKYKDIYNMTTVLVNSSKHNPIQISGFTKDTSLFQKLDLFMADSNGSTDIFTMAVFNKIQQAYVVNEDPAPMRGNYYNNSQNYTSMSASGSVAYTNNVGEVSVSTKRKSVPKIDAARIGLVPAIAAKTLENLSGVDQAKEVAGLSLGGGRAANTLYIIDGVVVRDASRAAMIGTSDFEVDESRVPKKGKANLQEELFDKLLVQNQNQIRTVFKDNAYWVPNFYTDANGKASIAITLPDNITNWKAFAIAMGEGFYYGAKKQYLKVYKPMQAVSFAPAFLYKGDSITVATKYSNFMNEPKAITIYSKTNLGNSQKDITLTNDTTTKISMLATTLDSVTFEAGLTFQDKYKDAELKKIPVMNTALKTYNVQTLSMSSDSIYQMQFSNDAKGVITFNNNLFERIVQYTKDLENYEYGCVEQTSSKLKAVIYQQILLKKLNKPLSKAKQINKLISLLQDLQNRNGSFGWWRKDDANISMTLYALDALLFANKNGYGENASNKAIDYLLRQIDKMTIADKLYTLYTLSENGKYNAIPKDLNNMDIITLSNISKAYYYKLKLNLGQTVSENDMYTLCLDLNKRIRYCGYNNFFDDEKANVFQLFKIFKGTSLEKQIYTTFKQQILNGALDNNLNTFSKAALIEALVQDLEAKNKPIASTLIINDSVKVKDFPFSTKLLGNKLVIKHTGSEVFVQSVEEVLTYNPIAVDSIFKINTNLNSNAKIGDRTSLSINIEAFKTKQYVMITVPIPSGFIVENKNAIAINGGDYLEYYKEKIIIYKQVLTQGTHNISVPLLAKNSGRFIMPAAQISLMYYPHVNGNNVDKVIEVK